MRFGKRGNGELFVGIFGKKGLGRSYEEKTGKLGKYSKKMSNLGFWLKLGGEGSGVDLRAQPVITFIFY